MFCSKCGTQVQDDMVFCSKCGTRLKELVENSEAVTSSSPEDNVKKAEDEVPSIVPINISHTQDSRAQINNMQDYVLVEKKKKANPIVFIIPAVIVVLGVIAGYYFWNKSVLAKAEEHFTLGKAFWDKNDSANAEKEFSEAIRLNPKKAEYYISRSYTHTDDKWVDKAIDDLSTAIKVDPKSTEAWSSRAFWYEIRGETDKAISDYNELIALTAGNKVENSNAYAARGRVYYSDLDYSKAIEDYNKAIELNSRNFGAYSSRAFAYSNVGEYYKSIEDRTFLITNNQNLASNYNSRAFQYYYIGRYNDALADINKAIAIDPNPNFYDTRGTIYRAMENFDKAISDYSEAIRLDSNNAIFWMNRSLAYYWKNNNSAAMNSDQNTAFRISTRDAAQAYVDIAINWANTGFYKDAVRMFNNALELDPYNRDILRKKAEAEEKAK
jgi:tetratricopeptide (TPR) repeat protein